MTRTERYGFRSILFEDGAAVEETVPEPDCLPDLNLDQVIEQAIAKREAYELAPFFYTPLHDPDAVRYRHAVFRDLDQPAVAEAIRAFAVAMRKMREHTEQARKLRSRYQKEAWFLAAVGIYCHAVTALRDAMADAELGSRGLEGLSDYLRDYAAGADFRALADETHQVRDLLAGLTYSIHIWGNRVKVSEYEGEPDYSAEVEEAFAKFQQGAVKSYLVEFREPVEMNHVEAQVLDLVAQVHAKPFAALHDYCLRHQDYLDETVERFDREVQFYFAYLEYIEPLRAAGLDFSYPEVSGRSKDTRARDAFDIALARKLTGDGGVVVCNDFELTDPERILVVTGPNQGGKTTFARMVGQLHYLAALGCPVPGRDDRFFLPDRVFTHFEKEEDLTTLRGKLEDDLVRIRQILERATDRSLVVMNESFSSTALSDALFLSTAVLDQISDLDALCVCVTFLDELSTLNDKTVSMVSSVNPADAADRTFKLARRPADGLAYAAAIAEKYGLTYRRLRERIAA
jgi:DNA mismatch repair protein MutS